MFRGLVGSVMFIRYWAITMGVDTTLVRSLDWDRDRFDIEFGLEKGTTYNSYIIRGAPGCAALVDSSHEKFRELYLRTLRDEIDPTEIKYIVCSHTEPDHSGLIGDVLKIAPNATVVGSKVALAFLENLIHEPFERRVVKGGDVIDLGDGHELKFIMAPNLHWPDTMFSYDPKSRLMYTCDAFGSHYCTEDPFDGELSALMPHYRFYYECLMKPNARSVLTALRKCESEGADFVDVPYGKADFLANAGLAALACDDPAADYAILPTLHLACRAASEADPLGHSRSACRCARLLRESNLDAEARDAARFLAVAYAAKGLRPDVFARFRGLEGGGPGGPAPDVPVELVHQLLRMVFYAEAPGLVAEGPGE